MLPYSRKNRCKDSVFLNSTSRITNYYGIYFQETDRIPGFWSLFAGIDAIYNIRKAITACSPAGTFATLCMGLKPRTDGSITNPALKCRAKHKRR